MCGIFCAIFNANNNKLCVNDIHMCLDNVYKKCINNINKRGPDSQNSTNIEINEWYMLLASSVLWLQGVEPVVQPVDTDKALFLYNGDIFDSELLSYELRNNSGDTKPLLNIIESSDDIIGVLKKVHGPYAFIYIDKINKILYFGRDIYGRRSLLIGYENDSLILSSVATRSVGVPMMELPAIGVFSINLNETVHSLFLHPWKIGNQHFAEKINELQSFLSMKINVDNLEGLSDVIYNIPERDEIEILEFIEKLSPGEAFTVLMNNDSWKSNVSRLENLLENAVEHRVENQPLFCTRCVRERLKCDHSLIGILFSGGLDCAIISLLTDRFIDKSRQIDLLNVAFEKGNNYETPDRLTARQTFKELQMLRPERKWNLLEINVTQEELCKERNDHIGDLIFPLRSILDESLGCALWFASRGKTEEYTSTCRVLFVGMGADELFGGYTRHRAAYKRGKWEELTKELDNDWKNISHRNLARDDRIVSDHGRQLRTPYLDENVVEFVRNLNAWNRCYPSESIMQGLGDKLLLRTLAFHLGLKQAAVLRKRALQFGSRIANSKENAHDISPRL